MWSLKIMLFKKRSSSKWLTNCSHEVDDCQQQTLVAASSGENATSSVYKWFKCGTELIQWNSGCNRNEITKLSNFTEIYMFQRSPKWWLLASGNGKLETNFYGEIQNNSTQMVWTVAWEYHIPDKINKRLTDTNNQRWVTHLTAFHQCPLPLENLTDDMQNCTANSTVKLTPRKINWFDCLATRVTFDKRNLDARVLTAQPSCIPCSNNVNRIIKHTPFT